MRVGCERCSRLMKKKLARQKSIVALHLLGLNKLYTLFEWPFFEKQVNVRCAIGSILMSIAYNRLTIARNSCPGYFTKLEALFSSKQQGAIRTHLKILSCTFYHHLTFDVFNNKTVFGAIHKAVILYLPMLVET